MTNLIYTCFILQYIYYNHLHVSSIICSSSGSWNFLMQHPVSSLSVSGRPVHRTILIILSFLLISHMYYWIKYPIQFSTLSLKWAYSQSHILFFEGQNKDQICIHTLKGKRVHQVTFPGYSFL